MSGDDAEALRARLRRMSRGGLQAEAPASATPAQAPRSQQIQGDLHERLVEELSEQGLTEASDTEVGAAVREFVGRVLETEDVALNETERQRLTQDLEAEALGVGPLTPLLADPAVSDILVNGPNQVYVERHGRLEETDVRFRDDAHVVRVIERIAARVGRRIDVGQPLLDARLPDGSRVNATLPPITIDGPTLSIRRFGVRRLRRGDLVARGALSETMAAFLRAAVSGRCNVLISGGTGAGKSTLLGALAEAISPTERVITIEDVAELVLDQPHVVRMETRPANVEGQGRVSPRDLVINALRMRPDRIVMGEVRGGEALDMLQAMNTGHDGSLCTIHANSPRDALSRLETMVLFAGTELPSRAIREQIAAAIDVIVHVRRFEDGSRRVESVAELTGLEGETLLTQEVLRFRRQGRVGTRIQGRFEATGVIPRALELLRDRGVEVQTEWFSA